MPFRHVLYSVFVVGVAALTVAMIGSYLSGSLRSVGAQLEEAAERMADLRELNAAHRQQHPVRPGHRRRVGQDPLHQRGGGLASWVGEVSEVRGTTVRDLLGSRLLDPAALEVRDMDRSLARLEIPYQRSGRRVAGSRGLGDAARAGARRGPVYLLVFQNLTEIKRLEREVQVKEKLAAVGEMAAHLAHEIRNPLGSISGSAQVLMSEPNISAEQARLLAIITKESQAALGRAQPVPVPGPAFQSSPGARGHRPRDRGGRDPPPERLRRGARPLAWSSKLRRCPARLPGRRRPDHAGLLEPGAQRAGGDAPGWRLEGACSRGPGRISASTIRDEGRGMGVEGSAESSSPSSRGAMGTGLGLAIVYRIVRDHRRRHQRAQRAGPGNRGRSAAAAWAARPRSRGAREAASWWSTTNPRCGSCWRSCCARKGYEVLAGGEPRHGGGRARRRGPWSMVITDIRLPRRRRHGDPAPRQAASSRDAGHRDDGLRLHRDGGGRPEAGRPRLPGQALRRRRAEDRRAQRTREAASCRRRTCSSRRSSGAATGWSASSVSPPPMPRSSTWSARWRRTDSTVLITGESGTGQGAGGQGHPRTRRRAGTRRSFRSTAARCRRRCWRASCSAT